MRITALIVACLALLATAQESPKPSNAVSLQLPQAIYAVPNVEINVYFDNIILAINPDNYVFDVDCRKGTNQQKRWTYVPTPEDKGTYDWSITVIGQQGIVAEAKTKLVVTAEDSGVGKSTTVLIVGDSLTNATVYPTRLFELMKGDKNPTFRMIGTNGPGGKPQPDGVAHEGWGGWTWGTFLYKTKASKAVNPPPYDRPSAFLKIDENGQGTFDFQMYLDKTNNGNPPDFIMIQLGVNDVFGAKDDNIENTCKAIMNNADKLIAEFRKGAPNALIGVGLVTPGAKSQDAFGENYKCGQTRWQYKKNQHRLNQVMLEKFSGKDPKVILIPTSINLDCENNYPTRHDVINLGNTQKITRQNNGVHPSPAGYRQMGDTYYAWLKAALNNDLIP